MSCSEKSGVMDHLRTRHQSLLMLMQAGPSSTKGDMMRNLEYGVTTATNLVILGKLVGKSIRNL